MSSLGDTLATGTWIGVGVGVGIAGAGVYAGVIDLSTFGTIVLLTALVIFVYWSLLQLQTFFCDLPIVGDIFCRGGMRSKKKKAPGT